MVKAGRGAFSKSRRIRRKVWKRALLASCSAVGQVVRPVSLDVTASAIPVTGIPVSGENQLKNRRYGKTHIENFPGWDAVRDTDSDSAPDDPRCQVANAAEPVPQPLTVLAVDLRDEQPAELRPWEIDDFEDFDADLFRPDIEIPDESDIAAECARIREGWSQSVEKTRRVIKLGSLATLACVANPAMTLSRGDVARFIHSRME